MYKHNGTYFHKKTCSEVSMFLCTVLSESIFVHFYGSKFLPYTVI